jgi:uncharacterized protein
MSWPIAYWLNERSSGVALAFTQFAFTPEVKAEQARLGSRDDMDRLARYGPEQRELPNELRTFIEQRDFFYIATLSSSGWPYIQHKGGPRGFLRAIDTTTLEFADIPGNRQYLTLGNLRGSARAMLFFVDHSCGTRLKIWVNAFLREEDEAASIDVNVKVARPAKRVGRVVRLEIQAWNIDCPRNIQRLYLEEELNTRLYETKDLKARVKELEAQLWSMGCDGSVCD